jgi:hypothetical protein
MSDLPPRKKREKRERDKNSGRMEIEKGDEKIIIGLRFCRPVEAS